MLAAVLESRFTTRVLIVCGTLGLVFAWRLDRAIKTAYESSWVSPGGDLRLPTSVWIGFHVAFGVVSILLLIGAALLWRRRECGVLFTGALGPTSAVMAAFALAFALGAAGARWAAALDAGKGVVTLAVLLNGLALVAVASLAFVNGNLFAAGDGGLAGLFKHVLERQRMNLVVVLALVAALAFLGDTSGQAIDSIRSWSPIVFDAQGGAWGTWSNSGAARLTLGLAAALLLALVVYESGIRLTQVVPALDKANFTGLVVLGLATTIGGGLLWVLFPFGPGNFPRRPRVDPDSPARPARPEGQRARLGGDN